MPGLVNNERSASPSSESDGQTPGFHTPSRGLRDSYPPASIPGYSERPLDEQLEPIAVIGMGCRLPGDVSSPSDFWDMLLSKGSGQSPKVPANRFNIDAHYHQNRERPGSFPVMGGYFINEDLENFDPGPFNISPIEAMWMDPQQRKLLEVVYEAMESAGASMEAIAGTRTGVFAASFTTDWQQMAFKEQSFRHTMSATGVDPGILSDRISYVFNLNGPSILCNTACSSSIYALHQACIALRGGECEAAFVGGTNLVFTVDQQMNTAKIGVLSPQSTCRTFDESADGYGRAEGVGAVYLKRLADAIRDNDPIRAVIRGSAVNHNGKASSASISYPGVDGQAYVMNQAHKQAGNLDPLLTGYFECHGTGTAVGDPIEVEAISIAMNGTRKKGVDDPLLIGAVKTNIGHGEAASGLSALIKAIFIVERGIIPPTIGIKQLSTKIKWEEWQVRVPVETTPFPPHLPVRRVSVNTCGYGGTNAHVIVEDAQSIARRTPSFKYYDGHARGKQQRHRTAHRKRPFLLPFSAHDGVSLRASLAAHAHVADRYDLLDLAYTLGHRRTAHVAKAFAVVTHQNLAETLAEPEARFAFADKKRAAPPTVGFIFTGQGSQWPRMGAELLEYSHRFVDTIRALDRALDALHDGPDWSIEDVLLERDAPVNEAEYAQPLCTAVQIALVDLLADWGVRPVVTVGHSSGEMAAAYAAGLLSAESAITAAYYRGKVTQEVREGGAMMAVGLGAEDVEQYLQDPSVAGKIVVACHNSPSGVTLSGDAVSLEVLKTKFEADKVFNRFVQTGGKAYHSHYMAPVAGKYEAMFRSALQHSSSSLAGDSTTGVRMVSSVTASVLSETAVLDEKYWSNNLRSPVLFNQAVQAMVAHYPSVDLLIEVGPHSAMSGPIKQIKMKLQAEALEYIPTLIRNENSATELLKLAGQLFLRSHPIKMDRVSSAFMPRGKKGSVIVDLPRYQWNYSRQFWPESRASREHRRSTHPRHDTLGQRVLGSSTSEPTWRNILRIRDLPWLKDHSLGGEAVFPAAGYFSTAIEAVTQIHERTVDPAPIESYVLRNLSIKSALVTPDTDDGIEVLTNLRPSAVYGPGWWDFGVSSVDAEDVTRQHMSGSVAVNAAAPRGTRRPRDVPTLPQRASGRTWNQALRDVGFSYGTTFQDMDDVRFDGKTYRASCATHIRQQVDPSLGESRHALHPASVDSTLQLSIAAIYAGRVNAMDCGVVPVEVDEVTIWPPTPSQVETSRATAYAWVDRRGLRSFENSVQMTAEDGGLVMEIVNVRTTSYEAAAPQKDEKALKPAPYGEMKWDLDVETLLDGTKTKDMATADLVNLILFKYPTMKVLDTSDISTARSVLQRNPQANYTLASISDADAKQLVEEYANTQSIAFDPAEDLASQSLTSSTFDIVVGAIDLIPLLQPLLKPGGFTIDAKNKTIQRAITGSMDEKHEVNSSEYHVQLVYRVESGAIVASVKTKLESLGWRVNTSCLPTLGEPEAVIAGHVIMLADLEGTATLDSVSAAEFAAIQGITNGASSLLWVTHGGLVQGKRPEHALASGLARTVTSEQASLDFRVLDFDPNDNDPSSLKGRTSMVESIARVAQLQHDQTDASAPEREFAVVGDKTYISRLVRHAPLNSMFAAENLPVQAQFTQGDRISGRTQKGKIVFAKESVEESQGSSQPMTGHVEVQLTCAGLTKEGVMVINGADYPTTFSHEIGGVVTKIAGDVTSLQPGDRVVGLHADTYASYQQVSAAMLCKLDPKDCMSTIVGTLMPYASALYGLETLARLRAGEKVLVLHETGLAGAAAVRIAQDKGAMPYVVVATEDEAAFVQHRWGLSKRQIIRPWLQGPIASAIQKLTDGHGVDVIFSDSGAVHPGVAREAWRDIAPLGRFIEAGRKHGSSLALDPFPFQRGAFFLPFDIVELLQTHPELVAELVPAVVDAIRRHDNHSPGPVEEIALANLDDAVARFSNGFNVATPVVQYATSDAPIQTLPPRRSKLNFDPNATYFLVGCLGGLGRSLTSWMMESGARRFTFLSRSGADAPFAAKLIRDIESAGALVQVIRGDATNKDDVERAVGQVSTAHPIRGVVHAAMVLRDGMFHSMAYDDWVTAVAPKVKGAQNLDAVFSEASHPLDFFLMTSSVSGILGTPGQSNYAAANSYLDALARRRVSQQLVATSCIIPMVLGVGVVAENAALEDGLRRKGMYGIDEEHLLQSFEAGIRARSSVLDDSSPTSSGSRDIGTVPDHVVVGLDPAPLQRAVADELATDSFWLDDARFSHVAHAMRSSQTAGGVGGGTGGQQSVLAVMKGAASPEDAVAAASAHFVEKLARMLLLPLNDVDAHHGSIASYGIDSMIGAELRNWIFKEYRFDIPFQQLLAPTLTIHKFAQRVYETIS